MDPALCELLRSGADDADEVEAIIRLDRPHVDVTGVRIVSRFGPVATCRLRCDSILRTWHDDNVASLKRPRALGPEPPWHDEPAGNLPPRAIATDRRRPPDVALTGAGVVVGVVDWGCDFDHPNLKHGDGSTRLLGLWDQRGPPGVASPRPYGYGTLYRPTEIDDALRSLEPFDALGYHPADADRDGQGAHGTHVMDIAAGNGRAGGPVGVAPRADLIFVHLAERGTGGMANLGDSSRILEAVDFIARMAGRRPWVINLSVGRCGGPHDGSTLAEMALDFTVGAAPGRFIVQSAGNYFGRSTHASGRVELGGLRSLTFVTHPADLTPNELEVWYPGVDELSIRVESPTGTRSEWVPLGQHVDVGEDGDVVGRLYHRPRDPNNLDNHVDLFLAPWAPAGAWNVMLRAVHVDNGVFHAWLERDEACGPCQARFVTADADRASTTGTIANGREPFVVGAYDAHSATRAVAPFSSAGPTRDGRLKPDSVAPGVQVLAARSAPLGMPRSPGLLTRKSGTSMAAPHVTGAIALCLEGARRPLASGEIRALLHTSTERVSPAGGSPRLGWGYLDIGSVIDAVSHLDSAARQPNTHRPVDGQRRRRRAKELVMQSVPHQAVPASIRPETLYGDIVYRREQPVPAWIDELYAVIAGPGEAPQTAPAGGDVLVRVALGERGLGHVAVLSTSDLIPWQTLDTAGLRGEPEGRGHYAAVIEGGSFPHGGDDLFARRILDQAGHVPPGQLLLRPRSSPAEGTGEEVGMSVRPDTAAERRCRSKWFARLSRLPQGVREVLHTERTLSLLEIEERVRRAVDLGMRDENLLTDFAFFALRAEERGYCPISRGEWYADEWKELRADVRKQLEAPAKPVEQQGPAACVGRRENILASPQPDQAPSGLTGRYEYTLFDHKAPDGSLVVNQAGRHLEVSISPYSIPGQAKPRAINFYTGDLDATGAFLLVNRNSPTERRQVRAIGAELEVSGSDGKPAARAQRVESRSSLFPGPLLGISRLLDTPAALGQRGKAGQVIDITKQFVSGLYMGPYLYRHEHMPLSQEQVHHLRQRFGSTEFIELVRRATAVEGHRHADDIERETARDAIERFADASVNNKSHGLHASDLPLARPLIRRMLSQGGFGDGRRRQSYLDWIQQISDVTERPIGESSLGVRPSGQVGNATHIATQSDSKRKRRRS